MSALVKLNLDPSNAWHTSSTENSVGRFFVARPSLNCATNPHPPGTTLVFTAVTSYRNKPAANRSSHAESKMRSKGETSWTYPPPVLPVSPSLSFSLSFSDAGTRANAPPEASKEPSLAVSRSDAKSGTRRSSNDPNERTFFIALIAARLGA